MVNKKPYLKRNPEEMILRDYLAIDRTALANERTLLAYVQTALALFVVGVTFLHIPLFRSVWFEVQGWIFVPMGLLGLGIGLVRYVKRRQRIEAIREETPQPAALDEKEEKDEKEGKDKKDEKSG